MPSDRNTKVLNCNIDRKVIKTLIISNTVRYHDCKFIVVSFVRLSIYKYLFNKVMTFYFVILFFLTLKPCFSDGCCRGDQE